MPASKQPIPFKSKHHAQAAVAQAASTSQQLHAALHGQWQVAAGANGAQMMRTINALRRELLDTGTALTRSRQQADASAKEAAAAKASAAARAKEAAAANANAAASADEAAGLLESLQLARAERAELQRMLGHSRRKLSVERTARLLLESGQDGLLAMLDDYVAEHEMSRSAEHSAALAARDAALDGKRWRAFGPVKKPAFAPIQILLPTVEELEAWQPGPLPSSSPLPASPLPLPLPLPVPAAARAVGSAAGNGERRRVVVVNKASSPPVPLPLPPVPIPAVIAAAAAAHAAPLFPLPGSLDAVPEADASALVSRAPAPAAARGGRAARK